MPSPHAVSPIVSNSIIASISPMKSSATVIVNGTGFSTGCSVMIGYVGCSNPSITTTAISCSIPAPIVAGQQATVVTCGYVSAVGSSLAGLFCLTVLLPNLGNSLFCHLFHEYSASASEACNGSFRHHEFWREYFADRGRWLHHHWVQCIH